MSKSKYIRSGFTLLELCVVIVILSILATIAILTYSHQREDEYDQEALSDMHTIYQQASQSLSDWNIGAATDAFHIRQGCVGRTISLADLYADNSYTTNANQAEWTNHLIRLPETTHHWSYNVCFGWVEVINGSARVQIPSFIIAASRFTGNVDGANHEIRYILHGSGIDFPLIGVTMWDNNLAQQLPEGLVLTVPAINSYENIN